jgi:hypothetical protein
MADITDYKRKYKELYFSKNEPALIEVPETAFAAVEGKGDPNAEQGGYKNAVELLYAIQYTIKMSKKGAYIPEGYFDYVVPPLEGLWWFENNKTIPPEDKSKYRWISMIRLPEFVNEKIFEWACAEVNKKKKITAKNAEYIKIAEGLCVQCMHLGSFGDEPKTIKLIDDFIENNNLTNDINETRRHHEIYLSDPRKIEESKKKTVLRIPVRKKGGVF